MFLHSHITTLKYRPCEHQNCNLQCKMQWIFPTLGLAEERQEQEVQQEGGVVCGHGAGQGGSGRVRTGKDGPRRARRGQDGSGWPRSNSGWRRTAQDATGCAQDG